MPNNPIQKKPLSARTLIQDKVDEASQESFPTSDAPAWNLGVDHEISRYLNEEKQSLIYQLACDHLHLYTVLNLIQDFILELEKTPHLDVPWLKKFCEFLAIGLEQKHSLKQEQIYPVLHNEAKRLTSYMINNLRAEHEYGKTLLKELHALLSAPNTDNSQLRTAILPMIKDIRYLYINHLKKEEEYILPFIRQDISAEQQTQLLQAFAKINEQSQKISGLLQDLLKKYPDRKISK